MAGALRDRWFAIIVVLFGGAAAWLAYGLNIWQDEAYTLYTTSGNPVEAWNRAVTFETQAPLYFVLLDAWRSLNHSVFFARLYSLICALLTLVVARRLAMRLVPEINPAWITAVIAMNPFFLWAAVEMRLYALAVFFSALLLHFFVTGFWDERPSRYQKLIFVGIAACAVYAQYLLGTLFVGFWLVLAVERRWKMLLGFTIACLAVLVLIAPLALVVPNQLGAYQQAPEAGGLAAWSAVPTTLLEFVFPHRWIGSWSHDGLPNALYFAVAVACVAIVLAGTRLRPELRLLLVTVAGTSIAFLSIIVIAGEHLALRHLAVLFIPTILLACGLASAVAPTNLRQWALRAFSVAYVAFCLLGMRSEFAGFAKTGDWRRVAAYIDAHERSGESILIFDQERQLPFSFYYAGPGPIVPLPRPLSLGTFNPADFVFKSEEDVARSLRPPKILSNRVWLVVMDRCRTQPVFYGCNYLERFVSEHYDTISTKQFRGTSVRELALLQHVRSASPEPLAPDGKPSRRYMKWILALGLAIIGAVAFVRLRASLAYDRLFRGERATTLWIAGTAAVALLTLGLHDALRPGSSVLSRVGLDFRAFYCSGEAVAHGDDPYLTEPLRRCEHRVQPQQGWSDDLVIPSPLPAYDLAGLSVLAHLPYERAKLVWYAALLFALAVSTYAIWRLTAFPPLFVFAGLAVADGFLSLVYGQLPAFVVASVSVSAYFLERRAFVAAALAAVVSMIEPHLGLPVCLSLFCLVPRTRPALSLAAVAFAVLGIAAVGPALTARYFATVLPAMAASELSAVDQYSLSHELFVLGLPAHASMIAGSFSYVVMVALGIAAGSRAAHALAKPALIVLMPAAATLLAGTYVHEIQFAAALPAAFVLAATARRGRSLAWIALALLIFPWQAFSNQSHSKIPLVPLAAILWLAFLATESSALPRRLIASAASGAAVIALILLFRVLPGPALPPNPSPIPSAALGSGELASRNWEAHLHNVAELTTPSVQKESEKVPAWVAILLLLTVCAVQGVATAPERRATTGPALDRPLPARS